MLHTARSRNDQVALMNRMLVRGLCDDARSALGNLIGVLCDLAERHAAALRSQRVDATMADRSLWNGGRVALYHRFTRRCFAQNAVHERMAVTLFHIGLDGVSSAHPDRLVDAHREVTRPDAPPVRED